MKTIKTTTVVILFLFISETLSATNGTYKGDTISYKFDKMLVEVVSGNYISNSPEKTQMTEHIEQVQNVLSEMSIVVPAENERINILFRDMSDKLYTWNYKELELKREQIQSKNLLVFEDGTIIEKGFGRYCICFVFNALEMRVFVEDLADLTYFSSQDFAEKANKGTESISQVIGKSYRQSPVRAWVDLRGDEPIVHIQNSYKVLDMLVITGGIGAGWVKNTFVSDIDVRFGLGFARRGMLKNIYSADWTIMYDFSNSDENSYFELNHFISLNWEHNFSNSPLNDKWYGFSLGYLVKRNNDFFKENTFRFSVNKKINDTISLKPELYFNDFFKNIYPGIRLSVVF